jgi:hypothetical protein
VRGGARVSLSWSRGLLRAGVVMFDSWHPWQEGMPEDGEVPGYFRAGGEKHESQRSRGGPHWIRYSITSPNRLTARRTGVLQRRASYAESAGSSLSARLCDWKSASLANSTISFSSGDSQQATEQPREHVLALLVDSAGFPCVVPLCPASSRASSSTSRTEAADFDSCGVEVRRLLVPPPTPPLVMA